MEGYEASSLELEFLLSVRHQEKGDCQKIICSFNCYLKEGLDFILRALQAITDGMNVTLELLLDFGAACGILKSSQYIYGSQRIIS